MSNKRKSSQTITNNSSYINNKSGMFSCILKDNFKDMSDYIYLETSERKYNKIAAFDIDFTIIKPISSSKFYNSSKDWVYINNRVVPKLKELNDNFKIVFLTNQGGVGKFTDIKDVIERLVNLAACLKKENINVCIQGFHKKNHYRKPSPFILDEIIKNNGNINIIESFQCGDAAGRPANGKIRKKDFSNSDYKFALNTNLKFQTPEMYFQNVNENIPLPILNPTNIEKYEINKPLFIGDNKQINPENDTLEIILMVGSPASGKSTFCNNYLKKYERINQDTLKTKDKCLKQLRDNLSKSIKCVVDNTNRDKMTRKLQIDLANEFKIPIRCFQFDYKKEYIFHLNQIREISPFRIHFSKKVDSIAIHSQQKQLEIPQIEEGFTNIKKIRMQGGPFNNDNDKRLFQSFL